MSKNEINTKETFWSIFIILIIFSAHTINQSKSKPQALLINKAVETVGLQFCPRIYLGQMIYSACSNSTYYMLNIYYWYRDTHSIILVSFEVIIYFSWLICFVSCDREAHSSKQVARIVKASLFFSGSRKQWL